MLLSHLVMAVAMMGAPAILGMSSATTWSTVLLASDATRWGPGTELEARRPIELDGARLREGGRASIVGIQMREGEPVAADVALADGHVCRGLPLSDLAQAFRATRLIQAPTPH
jgi:hypothetical protein